MPERPTVNLRPVDLVHMDKAIHFTRRRLQHIGVLEDDLTPDQLIGLAFATIEWYTDIDLEATARQDGSPVRMEDVEWARPKVREAMTVGSKEEPVVIRSMLAAARALELGSDGEAFGRAVMSSGLMNIPDEGDVGPWLCILCGDEFPVDFIPDHCPKCGAGLMRTKRVNPKDVAEDRKKAGW